MMGVESWWCSGRKDVVVGFEVGKCKHGGAGRVIRGRLGWFGSGLWLGRAKIVASLVKMAFGRGDRVGGKFGKERLGESGKIANVMFGERFGQS
jgi:hypothetical protein